MLKRIFLITLILTITVLALSSCGGCEHEWTEASCSYLSRCKKCNETRGGVTDNHSYADGFCTLCKAPSEQAKEDVAEIAKASLVSMWQEKYNDKEPMAEPLEIDASVSSMSYSDGKVSATVTLYLKMKTNGYFTTNMALTLTPTDEGYAISEGTVPVYSTFIELDPAKKYALHLFSSAVTFSYKTGNGEEKISLKFESGKVTRSVYDESGALVSATVMKYVMNRTPEYNIIIMKDEVYEQTAIFKNGEGITQDGKLYILDRGD